MAVSGSRGATDPLDRAFARMTALERRVLALAYGEGLTQAQIADSLAVSRSAVSRAVLRAMHLVADSVEAEADAR